MPYLGGKKYGFDKWTDVSYAVQPSTNGFDASLNRNLEGGVIIMADRPKEDGKLDEDSANHGEDGTNMLNYNGSTVLNQGKNSDAGVDGDHIFKKDGGADDSWLWWGNQGTNGQFK